MTRAQHRKDMADHLKQTLGAINSKNQSACFGHVDSKSCDGQESHDVDESHFDNEESRQVAES